MPDLPEHLQVPLHELSQRVIETDNELERTIAFSDWVLRVIGAEDTHGMDALNNVMRAEFGPQAGIRRGPDFHYIQRKTSEQYRERKGQVVRHKMPEEKLAALVGELGIPFVI